VYVVPRLREDGIFNYQFSTSSWLSLSEIGQHLAKLGTKIVALFSGHGV